MTPMVQAASLAVLTLGTGATAVSVLNEDMPDMAVPNMAWVETGALDGKAFAISATLDNGEHQTDELRFRDGGFLSVDCELYCNFGFSDYQTASVGDVIHFTATARCPTAPHTVVWYGRVEGDEIDVEMSWTTRRWYWTHQILGSGGGVAIDGAGIAG